MCIDIPSIIMGGIQIKQGKEAAELAEKQEKRDEKRYRDDVFSEATKFIQKYTRSEEIRLLPNCVMAYKYNLTYPYRREMYSEFNALREEVHLCVLERCKINLVCNREYEFYDKCLQAFKEVVSSKYGINTFLRYFYEGAKYFERSLRESGEYLVPRMRFTTEKVKNILYESHITDLLSNHDADDPISELFIELDQMIDENNSDLYDIMRKYLNCECIKWVSFYNAPAGLDILSDESLSVSNSDYEMQHSDDWYMEDLFLEALLEVYVYQIKYKNFVPTDK